MVYNPVQSAQSLDQHQDVVVQSQARSYLQKLPEHTIVDEGAYVKAARQISRNQKTLELVQFFEGVVQLRVRRKREPLVYLL